MTFYETPLRNAYVVDLQPFRDNRGYFVRMFDKKEFRKIGFEAEFVQMNHAVNNFRNTFRGIHYQVPPFSEIKLIRCVSGRVMDFIVDIRHNSPTFLQSFSIELSEKNPQMLLVPEGFAHGYLTLEDHSGMIYFHTAYYKPGFEGGLRYDDPELNIKLPKKPEIISDRDLAFPLINESKFEGINL